MKWILILCCLLFTSTYVFSMCLSSAISVWPKATLINANPVIIVEGYGTSQDLVAKMTDKHPVYLQSGNHRVALTLISKHESNFLTTQVLLKPEEILMIGSVYEIVVENLDSSVLSDFMHSSISPKSRPKWMVMPIVDNVAPVFEKEPSEVSNTYIPLGCGPKISVNFDCSVKEASTCYVKATVTSQKHPKQFGYSYYLPIINGMIELGRDMCSGAFKILPGDEYEVVFQLMDASGNHGSTITKRLPFVAPSSSTLSRR